MRAYITAAAIAVAAAASAQTWTLDSCITYAIEHNIDLQLSRNQHRQAQLEVTEAYDSYLPRLNAGASQTWNLGRGLTAENTYADRNTTSTSWSAQLSLPLFSGLATERRIAYNKASMMQVAEQYEAAKENVTVNVTAAYLQALYAGELHQVAVQQTAISEGELQRRQALLEAGKIPEADLLDAEWQLAQDRLQATQAYSDWVLARLDLAQLLQLDVDPEEFAIAPVSDFGRRICESPAELCAMARNNSHAVAATQLGVDASERSIRLAQTGYLPTLSFNAGLGSSFYKVSGMPNESFGAQMRHNYSTYFGFSLNVPIFDAFSTRNSVRRAKLQRESALLELDRAEQQLQRTITQAYYQATGAEDKLEACIAAEQAAQAVFEATSEKYNLGCATPLEYEQAKTKAMRTTAERIQAQYELALRTRILYYYAMPH